MDELEVAFSHPHGRRTDCNHIFLNFVPTVIMDAAKVKEAVTAMVVRYGPRLWKLRVLQAELRMVMRPQPGAATTAVRLCLANDSGYFLDISMYTEQVDPRTGIIRFDGDGPLHGLPVSTPYMARDRLQQRRFTAQQAGTSYVYDLPDMFRQAVEARWRERARRGDDIAHPPPDRLMELVELVLVGDERLAEVKRAPGENDIGMVAWRLTLRTPEYRDGRDLIVIANDMTFAIGSFGPREDRLFQLASEMARELGMF